jgi:hypothetical protein
MLLRLEIKQFCHQVLSKAYAKKNLWQWLVKKQRGDLK